MQVFARCFSYILAFNANIIDTVLVAVVCIFVILVFPIFTNIRVKFDKIKPNLYYKISFFGIISIINGYAQVLNNEIIFHLTKKKAVIVKGSDIFSIRKKFKPLQDYHLIKLNCTINLGFENNALLAMSLIHVYNYFFNLISWYFYHNKPYLSINNEFNFYEQKDVFSFRIKGVILFNLLMILISIFKILMEKIIYAIRIRAQQNQ